MSNITKLLQLVLYIVLFFNLRKAFIKNLSVQTSTIKLLSIIGGIISILPLIFDFWKYQGFLDLFKLISSLISLSDIYIYYHLSRSISNIEHISKSLRLLKNTSLLRLPFCIINIYITLIIYNTPIWCINYIFTIIVYILNILFIKKISSKISTIK